MSDVQTKDNEYELYLKDLENKLLESKNLILSGPPGTGKTYLAKIVANKIVGNKADDVITNDGPVRFVQFHPSYDYTDFVEGLRPVNSSDSNDNSGSKSISFERMDGIFKSFCKLVDLNNKNCENKQRIVNKEVGIYKPTCSSKEIEKKIVSFFHTEKELIFNYSFNDVIKTGVLSNFDITTESNKRDFEKNKEIIIKRKNPDGNFYILNPLFFIRLNNIFTSNSDDACLRPFIKKLIHFFLSKGSKPSEDLLEEREKYIKDTESLASGRRPQRIRDYFPLYVLLIYNLVRRFEDKYSSIQTHCLENIKENRTDNYVFIIDEINRGDLGKIFGELFYSIDPDYRGESGRINTQYQNLIEADDCFAKGFYVPDNVYIIGTMNDIDRSVESMDFAIRRRFTFVEVPVLDNDGNITPQELKILDSIEGISGAEQEVKDRFISLNTKIKDTQWLGDAYQIGASYFKSLKKIGDKVNYDDVWNYRLKPLLKEYLRGRTDLDEQLIALKAAYDNKNNDAE